MDARLVAFELHDPLTTAPPQQIRRSVEGAVGGAFGQPLDQLPAGGERPFGGRVGHRLTARKGDG
jgi:hypothetical protein